MGRGASISCAISRSTRFCAPVGLNGSMALICLAHAVGQLERDARHACAPCCASSASPHSSQKNSSKISRNCAGERKAFSRRRSVSGGGKCVSRMARPAVRQFQLRAAVLAAADPPPAAALPISRCISARSTRVLTFADGFVNRHHAAQCAAPHRRRRRPERISNSGCMHASAGRRSCRTPPCRTAPPSARARARRPDSRHETICPASTPRERVGERGFEQAQVAPLESGQPWPSALPRSPWPFRPAPAR